MLKPSSLITYFLFSCFALSSNAQTISEQVDSYLEKAMQERHVPGLALAVIRDGVPVKVKGYGLADIENRVPVHPETIFQSGSVGKQFTAAGVLLLKEQGKLQLDDKITKYFPGSPAAWQNITIRNLLTHTSGIPNYGGASALDLRKDYTEGELLQLAMKLPLDFQPGEKWQYSNTGYVLLGILIHQVTGKFYGELLKEKIFVPLSMETARIINEADIVMNRSSGYRLSSGEWINQNWASPSINTGADGLLYLTILDFIKWEAALTQEKILTPEDLRLMFTPVKLNNDSLHPYGFGWYLDPVNGHKTIYHGGSWQGYNSFIMRFPDDKLSVIGLANLSPANIALIIRDVAGLYIPELARAKFVSTKDKNLALKDLVTHLFTNPGDTTFHSPLMSKESRPKIKALLPTNSGWIKVFGPVQHIEALENKENNVSRYLVNYKIAKRLVTITHDTSGLITDIITESY